MYLPTVMVVFRNGEYNQKKKKLWKIIFLVLNFQWATKIRRLSLYVCIFHVKCSKKPPTLQIKIMSWASVCLGQPPGSKDTHKWSGCSSGKQLAYKQDCMQKLKWCLLCSAAADLFNELMEKLLFFCLCFLCEACEWGLWMKAKSLNSTGHQQKPKAVDNKLRLTERKKNYSNFHGIALMCLAGPHPFALPQGSLKAEANFHPAV